MIDAPSNVDAYQERVGAANVFYDLRNYEIAKALVKMRESGTPIDLSTLYIELKQAGKDDIIPLAYLAELHNSIPSSGMFDYYLKEVVDMATLRQVITHSHETMAKAYSKPDDIAGFLDEVGAGVARLSEQQRVEDEGIKSYTHKAVAAIESIFKRDGGLSGISTGFRSLDKMLDGLQPKTLTIIGARPSSGKTSLAVNLMENIAIEQKIPVGMFSLEMSGESLSVRMITSQARVNISNLRWGAATERDFAKLNGAAARIANAPIHVDERSGLNIYQIRAKIRQWKRQFGIKVAIIDYLQFMAPTPGKYSTKDEEIGVRTRLLKETAKEEDIAVIALSQLGRGSERDEREPRSSDLRESGNIEQDADVVMLLWRVEQEGDNDECGLTKLKVAKQRNGPTGTVDLNFVKAQTRFEEARGAYVGD